MTADALLQVHEPLKWKLQLGKREQPRAVADVIRNGLMGARIECDRPSFLQQHQVEAYTRVLSTIRVYGGALLCDSVGLGKTYVSLAIAKNFDRILVVVPGAIVHQWQATAKKLGVHILVRSHETFSRGRVPSVKFDLVIVDEAHRFRNPKTNRYRCLSHTIGSADLLLVTATPVVNGPRDLLHLLRLFLPDHGLALHGIPSLEMELRHGTRRTVLKQVSPLMTARSSEAAGIFESSFCQKAWMHRWRQSHPCKRASCTTCSTRLTRWSSPPSVTKKKRAGCCAAIFCTGYTPPCTQS